MCLIKHCNSSYTYCIAINVITIQLNIITLPYGINDYTSLRYDFPNYAGKIQPFFSPKTLRNQSIVNKLSHSNFDQHVNMNDITLRNEQ